jgi:hypothetical protein
MHNRTYLGLQFWTKKMFEKLGYMLLAHRDNQKEQLQSYVDNLKILLLYIENKINYYNSLMNKSKNKVTINIEVKIHDMQVLHENVNVLMNFAKELCKTCKKNRSITKK